ncbi:TPA: 50S ribosomal protein L29 [bacterium]|jgi:large subunit ribosomal protein L29|nr:50S ribosomal protein L29 [bacterium]
MRKSEMRQLAVDDLRQRVVDSKDELFRLKFQLNSGQLQNYRRIREIKREIAQIKTIIKEKELGGSV